MIQEIPVIPKPMKCIIQGTTPTLCFRIPDSIEDLDTITDMWIMIKSRNSMITKKIDDITLDDENFTASITLTQKETLSFSPPDITVQIKMLIDEENVIASHEFKINIHPILDTHIMEADEEEEEDD